MKKKVLSLVLALVMCLGLTVPAFADSGNGYTDPSAENVEFSVPPIGVATIRWVFPEGTSEYTAYVFDQDCTVTRKDGTPFEYFGLPSMYGDAGYSVQIGVFEEWAYVEEEWAWVEAGSAGIRANRDDGWAFNFAPEYTGGDGYDWSPLMMSKKGLDTVFPFENKEYGVTGTVVEYRPLFSQPAEPDAPAYQVSNWAKDRVALAVETNLAADSLGNDYRVNITRAQFAATAVKLYEAMSGKTLEAVTENPFTDTTDPVILQAADMGFVSGVGGGKFSPDALVTREQAAVMLSSVFTKLGGEISAVESTTFADDSDVASWARNAVAFMNSKEIVTGVGDNNFSPKGNASIEQALLISLKMFETLK